MSWAPLPLIRPEGRATHNIVRSCGKGETQDCESTPRLEPDSKKLTFADKLTLHILFLKVPTHDRDGKRVQYFADDGLDRSVREMAERERLGLEEVGEPSLGWLAGWRKSGCPVPDVRCVDLPRHALFRASSFFLHRTTTKRLRRWRPRRPAKRTAMNTQWTTCLSTVLPKLYPAANLRRATASGPLTVSAESAAELWPMCY